MGTVSLFSGKTEPVVGNLSTEEQALAVAHNLATIFAVRADQRHNRAVAPKIELSLIAKSGLLGISVPSEYGGIDVANTTLTDVIVSISTADTVIAHYLQDHFYVLDTIRATGSDEFKRRAFTRALSGALFGCLPPVSGIADMTQELDLRATGSVFTVEIPAEIADQDTACDWIGVLGRMQDGSRSLVLLDGQRFPAIVADDFFPYSGQEKNTTSHELRVPEGSVSSIASAMELKTSLALRQLLGAAIALGGMTNAFSQALDIIKFDSTPAFGVGAAAVADERSISTIGSMAARLDGAKAMVESASRLLDIAQVTPNHDHIENASRAALAADIVTSHSAIDIQQLLAIVAEPVTAPVLETVATLDTGRHCYELGTRHLAPYREAACNRP